MEYLKLKPIYLKYFRDEVLVRKKTATFLFYGPGGEGKTMAGVVPLAADLDPTFSADIENRYMCGDQYHKLAAFYDKPLAETVGKAYIWDEAGLGAFSENHAMKVVKTLATLGQIARIKYAFILCTLTDIRLLTSVIRHQYRFTLRAVEKLFEEKKTKYKIRETVQSTWYNSYGEPQTVYNDRPIMLPPEYWRGTRYEDKNPVLDNFYIHLAKKELLSKIEPLEKSFKEDFNHRAAQELREGIRKKRSDDIYDSIAVAVSQKWDEYIVKLPRSQRIDKAKISEQYAVGPHEIKKILQKVQQIRLQQGYLSKIAGIKYDK